MALVSLKDVTISFGGPLLLEAADWQIEVALQAVSGERRFSWVESVRGAARALVPDDDVRRQLAHLARLLVQGCLVERRCGAPGGMFVHNSPQPTHEAMRDNSRRSERW